MKVLTLGIYDIDSYGTDEVGVLQPIQLDDLDDEIASQPFVCITGFSVNVRLFHLDKLRRAWKDTYPAIAKSGIHCQRKRPNFAVSQPTAMPAEGFTSLPYTTEILSQGVFPEDFPENPEESVVYHISLVNLKAQLSSIVHVSGAHVVNITPCFRLCLR